MRPQPLICVHDVEASSRWYQRLLGCRSAHGGAEYERLVLNDRLVLQLHGWDVGHDAGEKEAIEIAKQCPGLDYGSIVELRPVGEVSSGKQRVEEYSKGAVAGARATA